MLTWGSWLISSMPRQSRHSSLPVLLHLEIGGSMSKPIILQFTNSLLFCRQVCRVLWWSLHLMVVLLNSLVSLLTWSWRMRQLIWDNQLLRYRTRSSLVSLLLMHLIRLHKFSLIILRRLQQINWTLIKNGTMEPTACHLSKSLRCSKVKSMFLLRSSLITMKLKCLRLVLRLRLSKRRLRLTRLYTSLLTSRLLLSLQQCRSRRAWLRFRIVLQKISTLNKRFVEEVLLYSLTESGSTAQSSLRGTRRAWRTRKKLNCFTCLLILLWRLSD